LLADFARRPELTAATRALPFLLSLSLIGFVGPEGEKFESSSLLILCNRLFSVSTGIAILFYKSRQNPQHGRFAARLRPSSPVLAYCAVAVSNFLSTMCQYEALRYVSYTTQSVSAGPGGRGFGSSGLEADFDAVSLVSLRSWPNAPR